MIEAKKNIICVIVTLVIVQILGCKTSRSFIDNDLFFVEECTTNNNSVMQYDKVVLVENNIMQQYIEINLQLEIVKSFLYWDIDYGRELPDTNKFCLKIKYESTTDTIYSTVIGKKTSQVLKLEFWNTSSSTVLDTSILKQMVCSFLELNVKSIGTGRNGEIRIIKNRQSHLIVYSEKDMEKEGYVKIFSNWFVASPSPR